MACNLDFHLVLGNGSGVKHGATEKDGKRLFTRTSWKSFTDTLLDDDAELAPARFMVRTPVPIPFMDMPLLLARRA